MQAVSLQQRTFAYLSAGTAGVVLSVLVMWILSLEPRYAFAGVAGLLMAGASMIIVRHMADVVLGVMAFNLPFTGIEKTLFHTRYTTFVVAGVSIGLAELCILMLYALWIGRVVIARTEPLPKPRALDWCVLGLWLAHVLSVTHALSASLTVLEVVRLAKYGLLYFYLAHNLRRRNLRWIAAGVCFALVLQTGIAVIQFRTGKLLGIGQTKGAEKTYDQYTVTGFEGINRAEGTTFDSHALGLFCAMALPIPLALALTKDLAIWQRGVAVAVFLIGLQGLVASFARAGYAAFAGAAVVLFACLLRGQYRTSARRLVPAFCLAVILAIGAVVPLIPKIRQRVFDAPKELLTARVETIEMGLEMLRPVMFTGIGANNYMLALERNFSVFEGDPYFIPAHNMLIFVLIELGILGLLAFLIFSGGVIRAGWRAVKSTDPLLQSFAAALLAGFVALHIEGIFDPIYVTNVTYFLVWFELGLIAGLERLVSTAAKESA